MTTDDVTNTIVVNVSNEEVEIYVVNTMCHDTYYEMSHCGCTKYEQIIGPELTLV